jgi:aspartokinase/homoserine dehydrogenase 1
MKILKFGGSSVKTAERIQNIIRITQSEPQARAVICSALAGITDELIVIAHLALEKEDSYSKRLVDLIELHFQIAKNLLTLTQKPTINAYIQEMSRELTDLLKGIYLIGELSPRSLDYILSFGERLSSSLITECFKASGQEVEYLDARKLIITDHQYGAAQVDFEASNALIESYFESHPSLQIITGFIGATPEGITTTIGRGGSDYTASIFAAALSADELEIWTDVDGVMTADPRKVGKAYSIKNLSYEEAMEMSHFGAKVIYAPTMIPVLRKNIPLRIRNTFNPDYVGTHIGHQVNQGKETVKGLASIDNVALLNLKGSGMVGISGISARLFGALAAEQINVILISQASSEHSICFAVKPSDAKIAKATLEEAFDSEFKQGLLDAVELFEEMAIIAAVGENMRHSVGIAGKFFTALGRNGISITAIAQGSSELNISVVIKKQDEAKALRVLHQAFFLSEIKTLHLFVVGIGLIGKAFLRQLKAQQAHLLQSYNLDIRLVGISNSRKHYFLEDGLSPTEWETYLEKSPEEANIQEFVKKMEEMNLINSIYIDNTANAEVAQMYEQVLKSSISIVTPNKIASSSSYAQYLLLKQKAKRHGVLFLYETNVGAALPVISTLRDLIDSGDQILRIEAVLSGTLSFIFNSFDGKKPFSEVVKEAKALGYTEPDPREDLNGSDVGRKILILGREAGFPLEFEDVKIKGFLPQSCVEAASVDDFFVALAQSDDYFMEMLQAAQKEGKVLRYIAKFEQGKVEVGLHSVDSEHPFYSLSGSDNILAFTTLRYPERPLVVKGSGAGAEVTAAGVLADMIRVANYL